MRQGAGIGRYTRELLGALARRNDPYRYRTFYWGGGALNGALPPLDARFQVRRWPISDRVANAIWHRAKVPVPVQWVAGAVDVYHSPDFTLLPTGGVPSLLTVHDLAFLTAPDCAFPTLRAYLQRTVPESVRRASHIVAVSQSTRDDVVRLLGVDPRRVSVVLEGVGPHFRPVTSSDAAPVLSSLGIAGPYILSVGTLEPRKNYVRLLEAYADLRRQGVRERLVIAGRSGWLFQPIFERVEALHLRDHVRFVQPSDTQLPALYSAASAFVFPSLYEGFGIPPLEAMACGSVVACSSSSSMPEVVGDAALLFDPLDIDGMVAAMGRALTDETVRERLRRRAIARASEFTWDAAGERTVALYREVACNA